MAERKINSNGNKKQKSELGLGSGVLVAGFSGGIFGGAAYGASRLAGIEWETARDVANRLGIGVAGGVGFAMGGMALAAGTHIEAENLAREGKKFKANLKTLQAAIEAAAGLGASGIVAGYEARGLTSSIIGGVSGAVVGLGLYPTFKGITDRAYKEGPLPEPEVEPKPEFKVIRDDRFPEKKGLLKYPPVYHAESISEMKRFREYHIQDTLARGGAMIQGVGLRPAVLVSEKSSAIFALPEVQHYPALDPEEDIKLKGLVKDPSSSMKLMDSNDNIIVHPLRHSKYAFWNYPTVFERNLWDENEWKAWRETSWKNRVLVLAQYQSKRGSLATPKPEDIVDSYWLIDISTPDQGEKRKAKEEKEEPAADLKPAFNPHKT